MTATVNCPCDVHVLARDIRVKMSLAFHSLLTSSPYGRWNPELFDPNETLYIPLAPLASLLALVCSWIYQFGGIRISTYRDGNRALEMALLQPVTLSRRANPELKHSSRRVSVYSCVPCISLTLSNPEPRASHLPCLRNLQSSLAFFNDAGVLEPIPLMESTCTPPRYTNAHSPSLSGTNSDI